MPIRNAASASPAKRLPLPASVPVTAYSLTKAWSTLMETLFKIYNQKYIYKSSEAHHHTFGPLRDVWSNLWALEYKSFADV